MTRIRRDRRGTVLPILGVCLIGLFTFVALAVDLGMLAISRTQCQNAADVGTLVGARALNNKPGVTDSNRPQAIQDAKDAITGTGSTKPGNYHLSANFGTGQISNVQAGMYVYDTSVTPNQFKADFATTPSAGQSWTAMRVDISSSQPTYFLRVFGVTTMPMGAYAIAVHRPRDVAFALDMTGSMGYSSQFNSSAVATSRSLNPDDLVPAFAHYGEFQDKVRATANLTNGNGEAFPRNNYTIATPGGPPIVRGFYFDASNATNPITSVTSIATKTVGGVIVADLLNAFHRWSPPESGGDSANYVPVTYNFAGYNAFHLGTETTPKGPTPAPGTFGTMTDGVVTYVGDRYRRADGALNKTDATWATGAATTKAAAHAIELLGYNIQNATGVYTGTSGGTLITTTDGFRDPVWETYGYDLDIPKYRAWRAANNSGLPATAAAYVAHAQGGAGSVANVLLTGTSGDRFKGYSMGPGYYGKTFFVWPPDPRWGNTDGSGGTANPLLPADAVATDPAPKDTAGKYICDWRQRFFIPITGASAVVNWVDTNDHSQGTTTSVTTSGSGTFSTQGDNSPFGTGADGINEGLLRNNAGSHTLGGNTQSISTQNNTTGNTSSQPQTVSGWRVNYPAVLKWIKSGPQVLPPNLRAGHVRYYTSIPDVVTAAGGSTETARDQQFWKNYIDYVLSSGYTSTSYLYGTADSWSGAGTDIYAGDMAGWTGPAGTWTSRRPYMRYNDSPNRPRLHFWFGPLSMMDFLTVSGNWLPGTCYEAQCWQLKAGMNSVLDDIRNNHPNDAAGLVLFSAGHHNDIRVPMGQNFTALKNALFYPKSLLTALDVTAPTVASVRTEYRPYNDSFSAKSSNEIPNAGGSTDPNTGLMYAFNLLSPSSALPAQYGTIRGRRGASKIVIFETDGVPNTYRAPTFVTAGYNSRYTPGSSSGNIGNNEQEVLDNTYPVVQQIVKLMQPGTSGDSGLSLPNAPAKVYAIGFGDLFDATLAPGATTARDNAHAFLAKVSEHGGTGPVGATTLTTDQIITGSYSNRISTLRSCMERIFQSGVSVTLIE